MIQLHIYFSDEETRFTVRMLPIAAALATALVCPMVSAQTHCAISIEPAVASTTINYPRDSDRLGTYMSGTLRAEVSYDCPPSPNGYEIFFRPRGLTDWDYAAWVNDGYGGIGVVAIGTNTMYGMSRFDRVNSTDRQRFLAYAPPAGGRGNFTIRHHLAKADRRITIPDQASRVDFGVIYTLHSYNRQTRETSGPLASYSINNGLAPRPACTIDNSNISVDLPPVSASSIGRVGEAAGRTHFAIGLTCNRQRADIHITLTDATTPGNRSDVLSLAPTSTAQGVGLRIRNQRGTAVSYGPDSWERGTVNQWLAGNTDTTRNIPMTVEYVSTGTVRPGTVRALATFTMSYQ